MTTLYPEIRSYLDRYDVEVVADRLDELLSYGTPFVVTDTPTGQPWVLVSAGFYDTLIAAWAGLNSWIEDRRQQAEPLPPIDVLP